MQIIELHEKCRGEIKKKFNVYPTRFTLNSHTQYTMIMTLRIELDKQRVRREKKGTVEVHTDWELDNEEDDFGEVESGNDNDNSGMRVGS